MQILPNHPYNNNSNAETRLFELIKEVPCNSEHCTAFHSLGLTHHEKKRIGEADFVFISTFGIFVLEIKGGGIRFENGIWYSQNKSNEYKIQDPFKQANDATHAITEKIKENSIIKQKRIALGYAVVFPDTVWDHYGAEWDREMIADANDLKDFDQWLRQLFLYWREKRANNDSILPPNDVQAICKYLRPNFETVLPLFNQIDIVANISLTLTEEQYHYVDMAMNNQRVLCDGGAGTGKTFLAVEMARRAISTGKKVILACKSLWLKNFLSTRFKIDSIVITTIGGIASVVRRSGIDSFDTLIVDEGQDLNLDDLQELNEVLDGGFDKGNWYFFHDANNQANVTSPFDDSCLKWLKSQGNPAIFSLNINCRNTINILNHIQSLLDCDLGKPALLEGPEVSEYSGSHKDLTAQLDKLLQELENSEIDNRSITILSPYRFERSLLSSPNIKNTHLITILDDYRIKQHPFPEFCFAEIADFKGLENEVVILLDLPNPTDSNSTELKSMYYVGMSRARAKLYCFWKNDL